MELSQVSACSPADEPQAVLRRALQLAESRGISGISALIENTLRLAAPLWDRSRPLRQSDMVLAATSLIAALPFAELRPGADLRGVLCALIALTPGDSPSSHEKRLVLVRN
ncbi:hypothetical protein [Spirillospora sp. CA-294931]|uniref:hypothetical protein n=1 Tax=Spirillospora sp. CA-294931 TaxID=3240042 RepID=UPI003D913A4B